MHNQQTQLSGKPRMCKSGRRVQVFGYGYVSDQSSMKSAVLIFHHFVFTYLLFLAVEDAEEEKFNVSSCSRGYMLKNRKCEGKKRKVRTFCDL